MTSRQAHLVFACVWRRRRRVVDRVRPCPSRVAGPVEARSSAARAPAICWCRLPARLPSPSRTGTASTAKSVVSIGAAHRRSRPHWARARGFGLVPSGQPRGGGQHIGNRHSPRSASPACVLPAYCLLALHPPGMAATVAEFRWARMLSRAAAVGVQRFPIGRGDALVGLQLFPAGVTSDRPLRRRRAPRRRPVRLRERRSDTSTASSRSGEHQQLRPGLTLSSTRTTFAPAAAQCDAPRTPPCRRGVCVRYSGTSGRSRSEPLLDGRPARRHRVVCLTTGRTRAALYRSPSTALSALASVSTSRAPKLSAIAPDLAGSDGQISPHDVAE